MFFQTTFFAACLALDAHRQDQQRCDVLCCNKRVTKASDNNQNVCGVEDGALNRVFARGSRVITKPKIRESILVIATGFFGICIYGVTTLEIHFDITDLYPKDSKSDLFVNADDRLFGGGNTLPRNFVIYTGDEMDYSDSDVQRQFTKLFGGTNETSLYGLINENEYYLENTLVCWYVHFRSYLGLNEIDEVLEPENFYTELNQFLLSEVGQQFNSSLLFDVEGKLKATLSYANAKGTDDVSGEVDIMLSLRDSCDQANLNNAFPFSQFFLFAEVSFTISFIVLATQVLQIICIGRLI